MTDLIITDPVAPAQPAPLAKPRVQVTLDGVHVEFPDGWWDHPRQDLVAQDGRTLREHHIDGLALGIATGLRQQLAARRPTSGLVGPDGRPL